MTNILQESPFIFFAVTGILGLIIGSFLNIVIYRLPIILRRKWERDCFEYLKQDASIEHKFFNLLTPRSHCPKCNAKISWWQNIPVISYILLYGKCNYCQSIIHWHYPLIELLCCLATLFVTIQFGINIQALAILILTWTLIAATFIDFDHWLLPDNITLPLIWLGLLLNTKHIFTSPENAIIGAVSGYLLLWIVAYVFKLIRKIDGMGHGDFKLFAAFGAWLGWQVLPIILFAASFIGSIVGIALMLSKKHQATKPIPFGPYLAIAGWCACFWGQNVLNWYLS